MSTILATTTNDRCRCIVKGCRRTPTEVVDVTGREQHATTDAVLLPVCRPHLERIGDALSAESRKDPERFARFRADYFDSTGIDDPATDPRARDVAVCFVEVVLQRNGVDAHGSLVRNS